jgi:multicomponent Na+:H+ antiporter subunit D
LSLAGIPPLSGFVGKLYLVWAAVEQAQYLAAGVAVAVSLLTLMSMLKIWNGAFWGDQPEPKDGADVTAPVRTKVAVSLVAPALLLATLSVALGVGAQPLLGLAEVAADGLVDTSGYVQAVTDR